MATDHESFRCGTDRKPGCPCSCHGSGQAGQCPTSGTTCASKAANVDASLDHIYERAQIAIRLLADTEDLSEYEQARRRIAASRYRLPGLPGASGPVRPW